VTNPTGNSSSASGTSAKRELEGDARDQRAGPEREHHPDQAVRHCLARPRTAPGTSEDAARKPIHYPGALSRQGPALSGSPSALSTAIARTLAPAPQSSPAVILLGIQRRPPRCPPHRSLTHPRFSHRHQPQTRVHERSPLIIATASRTPSRFQIRCATHRCTCSKRSRRCGNNASTGISPIPPIRQTMRGLAGDRQHTQHSAQATTASAGTKNPNGVRTGQPHPAANPPRSSCCARAVVRRATVKARSHGKTGLQAAPLPN